MAHVGNGAGALGALDDCGTFRNGDHDFVGVVESGVSDVLVLELDCVGVVFNVGIFGVTQVDVIAFW